MLDWLRGKRTYILAAGALAVLLARYLNGDVDAATALNEALVALGLVTARVGAKNDAKE